MIKNPLYIKIKNPVYSVIQVEIVLLKIMIVKEIGVETYIYIHSSSGHSF